MQQKQEMTDSEQELYIKFQSEVKKHLKHMSKNDLIRTCVALLVDNYGLKGALAGLQKEDGNEKASS